MTFRRDFQHRDDLFRAAVTEFSERGYEDASINRILATSGMSKGQLYYQFTSKEGLYLALVEWMIDRKIEWLATHPVELNDDFIAALRTRMQASLEFAAAHPDIDRFSRALLAERGRPIFAKVVSRYGFDPDSALGGFIKRCYVQGQFRNELSLDFIRSVVLAVINNVPELLDLNQPADLDPRIDEVLTFLRGGLFQPSTAHHTPPFEGGADSCRER